MIKLKKYRVILDFWKIYQADAEELKQEDPDMGDETADMIAWDSISDDLEECIIPEIDRHAPHGIAVFADLGLWNGRRREPLQPLRRRTRAEFSPRKPAHAPQVHEEH